MKNKTGKWLAGVLMLLVLAAQPVSADEPLPPSELQLPDDPAPEPEQSAGYQEHRAGGRLERVTITHENGLTEIYRNNRADTVWSAPENEIGEVPNMRQWVIGTW